uniref:BHLH domain-containing protein n=1 Tax=Oryza punctata TaxID=4537 RepID=A0A0E0LN29_ORYPU
MSAGPVKAARPNFPNGGLAIHAQASVIIQDSGSISAWDGYRDTRQVPRCCRRQCRYIRRLRREADALSERLAELLLLQPSDLAINGADVSDLILKS